MASPSIVGSVTTFDADSSATTVTFDVVVPSGADKTFATLSFFDANEMTVTAITLDGNAMSLIDIEYNSGANNGAWAYEIDSPSAATYSFSVTFGNNNGSFQKRISVSSLQDCTGFGATGTSIETASSNFSAGALTSTTNDLAIGTMMYFPGPRVVDGDDTEISTVATSGGRLYTFSTVAGASTTTVASTLSSSSGGVIIGFIAQGTGGLTASGTPTLAALTMAGSATINGANPTASGTPEIAALTMAGSATLNAALITASGAPVLPALTMSGSFIDDFDGSGDLDSPWEIYQESSLPVVAQVSGRYRANLTNNASDITLWFNSDEGRGDYIEKTGEFEFIAYNIGIGTQADSQDVPPDTGSTFNFCGINIWDSVDNSAHIVVGHRGGSANHTIENKGTISGSSTVTDEGTNAAPLGRMDLRVVKNASNVCEISYRAPNSGDSWTLSNSDGTFPSPPTFGATVRVQLITYAQGTAGVPFVGTCDGVEFVGANPAIAVLSRKVETTNIDMPALTMIGSATINAAPLTAVGALAIPAITSLGASTLTRKTLTSNLTLPAVSMAGIASITGVISAQGNLIVPVLTMAGVARLNKSASGALVIPSVTMEGFAEGPLDASGALDIPAMLMSGVAVLNHSAIGVLNLPSITLLGSAEFPGADISVKPQNINSAGIRPQGAVRIYPK